MPILLSDCIVAGKGESRRAGSTCFGTWQLHRGLQHPPLCRARGGDQGGPGM